MTIEVRTGFYRQRHFYCHTIEEVDNDWLFYRKNSQSPLALPKGNIPIKVREAGKRRWQYLQGSPKRKPSRPHTPEDNIRTLEIIRKLARR